MVKLQPETSWLICRILAWKLISIARQPVLLAASRCHLIQMLRSALTCTNGCSCWSPDEKNSPQVFPYHGCALPTELGGRVTDLQLGTDIVSTTPMKQPINRALISMQRRRATGSLVHQPSQRPPHQLTLRRPRPCSRCFTPPASRPDRAATQALRLGNPVTPVRKGGSWTRTSLRVLTTPSTGSRSLTQDFTCLGRQGSFTPVTLSRSFTAATARPRARQAPASRVLLGHRWPARHPPPLG
jgi:hypothetical protein